jgi:uncharacterized protein YdaU (DUF1376 family)
MTPAEFGSYVLLKMHYWRFGALPTDDQRLARIAKVTDEQWREIMPSIGPLFEDDWRDPRLEEQRTEAEERHRKLSEAGKRGGRPRKEEKGGFKPGFSPEKAGPKQPEPEPEPDPYSDLAPNSDPEDSALDKGKRGTDPREDMFTAFPIPSSTAKARQFLDGKDVPQSRMDECIRLMMGGNFTPYDLEGIIKDPRSAAA